MPVILPKDLPAYTQLKSEGWSVIAREDVLDDGQDKRLRVAIMNIMPKKIETETQLCRGLAASDHTVEPVFLKTLSHESRNTAHDHLERFYTTYAKIKDQRFDGLIITGAPVEHLDFDKVTYWQEFLDVLAWSEDHVDASLFICWAAQGALYHWHGVPKRDLPQKMFGVFSHTQHNNSPILKGLPTEVDIPASRHTEVDAEDLKAVPSVEALLVSEEAGVCLMQEADANRFYVMNHFEYDADTLMGEYQRDVAASAPIQLPRHYFPKDDPSQMPERRWKDDASTFYRNWVEMIATAKRARQEDAA